MENMYKILCLISCLGGALNLFSGKKKKKNCSFFQSHQSSKKKKMSGQVEAVDAQRLVHPT